MHITDQVTVLEGNEFVTLAPVALNGIKISSQSNGARHDLWLYTSLGLFPSMTKCVGHAYGASNDGRYVST